MRNLLEERIATLSAEIEALEKERQYIVERDRDISVRLHQIVGAIYEMQQIIADLDRQASDLASEAAQQADLSTHLSEGDVQDTHQEQQEETEKTSQPQS